MFSEVSTLRSFVDAGEHNEVIGPCLHRQSRANIDREAAPTALVIGVDDGADFGGNRARDDMRGFAGGELSHEMMLHLVQRHAASQRAGAVFFNKEVFQGYASTFCFGITESPDSKASLIPSATPGNGGADLPR